MSKIEGKQLKNLRLGTSQEASPVDGSIHYNAAEDQIIVRDGLSNIIFQGGLTQYTDEMAQDAVGNILTDSSTIDFTYNDVGNSITASVIPSGIDKNTLGGGALTVNNGGTGQASYTDGQLLIGNTSTGGLSKTTLTAGNNIGIINGNGTISVGTTIDGFTSGQILYRYIDIDMNYLVVSGGLLGIGASGTMNTVNSSTYALLGRFVFNPLNYTIGASTVSFLFKVIAQNSNIGTTSNIRIYNATAGTVIPNTTLTLNATTNVTILTSGTLNTTHFTNNSENIFEVQANRSAGSGTGTIYSAQLIIVNTF